MYHLLQFETGILFDQEYVKFSKSTSKKKKNKSILLLLEKMLLNVIWKKTAWKSWFLPLFLKPVKCNFNQLWDSNEIFGLFSKRVYSKSL